MSEQRPRQSSPYRLGILGGCFDPIHNGHLIIAEKAQTAFKLDKVVFVPAFCPPHKSRPILAPFEHRLQMIRLAIEDRPAFELSDIERHGTCPSYAGTTIERLKEGHNETAQFYFITGLDALPTLCNRLKSRTYPGLCRFIGTTRPGFNRAVIEKEIPPEFQPYVVINEIPALAVSSTDIKYRVRTNQSIDGMVPDRVKEYISTFNIYTQCFT